MSLIVSVRAEEHILRFAVHGRWEYNDALTLAYQVKAAGLRTGLGCVLLDVRDVVASPAVEGKFLVCDRLHRVLPPHFQVALVAHVDRVDVPESRVAGTAGVVLFASEGPAVVWLGGIRDAIKNPPVLRSRDK